MSYAGHGDDMCEGEKFCVCKLRGHRAVGLSHDFLDIYQFPHRISNKIVALAVSQE